MTPIELIEHILRTHCGIKGEITPDSRLREDLGMESLGLLTLMVELENSLQRQLQENQENPPQTVAELAAFLEQLPDA
jgi:acyl carrier protein